MKITLTGEESLSLQPASGPLTIEAQSREHSYSAFHMLGSALGSCTMSVLQSWASNKNLAVDDLRIDIGWSFAESQHRLDSMRVKLEWPSLPPELWPRAIRVAHLCGIHQTLTRPFDIQVNAVGVDSPSIEPSLDLESRRRSGKRGGALPQGEEQPKATSAP
jgi:uncharacterized OsmC-like protein